jgi:hypothetical protein
MIRLKDSQISQLINEQKFLPSEFRDSLLGKKIKEQDAHRRGELKVEGGQGSTFFILTRMNKLNPLDFSVILAYEFPDSTGRFLLRRYNGKSHWHTNQLDRERFRDFHIHYATERYQEASYPEESYAQVTNRYSDAYQALDCLIQDCGFVLPADEPMKLF